MRNWGKQKKKPEILEMKRAVKHAWKMLVHREERQTMLDQPKLGREMAGRSVGNIKKHYSNMKKKASLEGKKS